jgi:hypothetical protein
LANMKKPLNNKDNMEWSVWWYVVCDMLVGGYMVCWCWYLGMVIGIENVDVFVNFLVKIINELKNQQ